jgi:hypothetical protein
MLVLVPAWAKYLILGGDVLDHQRCGGLIATAE